jgi:asparagine synthetase B (glutamine-hydrolysing)
VSANGDPGPQRTPDAIPERLRLRPLEELWVIPIGRDEATEPLPDGAVEQTPRAALEQAILPALLRPPCLVSFSGGVDSSAVLALATDVARREGLQAPIPVTNRFPGVPQADESSWQEMTVGHLGLQDWVRLDWHDELDIVGPVAAKVLERHGIVVPFNSHFHYPLLERAAGGSLLTGIGGDELFETVTRASAAHVLYRKRRPRVRDLPALAFGVSPRRARMEAMSRRRSFREYRWIVEDARRRLARAYADWESRDPLRWDRSLREWWWTGRVLQCNLACKRALAGDFDVEIGSPLTSPSVIQACARAGAAVGLGSRAQALRRIVGDLFPPALGARRSKASFNEAFWNRHARTFASEWDGSGVDVEGVSVEDLRREWASPDPDPHSFALLHRAWLSSRAAC